MPRDGHNPDCRRIELLNRRYTTLRRLMHISLAGCFLASTAYLSSIASLSYGELSQLNFFWRLNGVMSEITPPMCALAVVFVWFLDKKAKLPTRNDVPVVLAAVALSLMTVLGTAVAQLKTITFYFGGFTRLACFLLAVASIAAAFFVCLKTAFDAILNWSANRTQRSNEKAIKLVVDDAFFMRLLRFAPIVLLLGWLPYIVLAAPGSISYDMTWMLQQFQGEKAFTTHHPLFATLLYGAVFSAGNLIGGSANFGVLAITLVQTIVWIAICVFELYAICALRPPRWLAICCLLFFAFVPVFGTYCQYAVKDSLFGAAFALYATLFTLLVKDPSLISKSKPIGFSFFVSAILVGLLRNNGFYVVLLSLPFFAFLYKGWRARIRRLVPIMIAIALVPTINSTLHFALNASSGSEAEALSILFQQTARYAQLHPDDITDSEYEAINAVLDYETIADAYQWDVSDPVKSTYKSGALPGYLKAWITQGIRHPGTYIDATTVQTYGYWYPEIGAVSFGQEGYCFETSYPSSPWWSGSEFESFSWTQWLPSIVPKISELTVERLRGIPFFGYLINDGIYTWILVVELAYFAYARRRFGGIHFSLALLPSFLLLLTCIAGPLCGSVRYMVGIMAVTPVLIAFTLEPRLCERTQIEN